MYIPFPPDPQTPRKTANLDEKSIKKDFQLAKEKKLSSWFMWFYCALK